MLEAVLETYISLLYSRIRHNYNNNKLQIILATIIACNLKEQAENMKDIRAEGRSISEDVPMKSTRAIFVLIMAVISSMDQRAH